MWPFAMRYLPFFLFVLGCFSCSVAQPQLPEDGFGSPVPVVAADVSMTHEYTGNVELQKSSQLKQSIYGSTYRIYFGPQLVTLRASYRDPTSQTAILSGSPPPAQRDGYFDLRATSALAGTGIVGEGEMAYGALNAFDGNMRPGMLRFALKNNWGNFTHGADYKSIAKGFTSVTGATAEQSRDEASIWGEQRLGAFKLRGSVGESWEHLDSADPRVTHTVASALQLNAPRWMGTLSTSLGSVEQSSRPGEEMVVFTNKLTTSFRPINSLLLEPNFSLKEERNPGTGIMTQTPTSGFSLTYSSTPGGFRLTGGTSFSRILNSDGTHDVRVYGASAGVDWKLGRFLGQNDVLSFSFNYNKHLDQVWRSNSSRGVSSAIKFKIAGF
jgi:hypothetical protein